MRQMGQMEPAPPFAAQTEGTPVAGAALIRSLILLFYV